MEVYGLYGWDRHGLDEQDDVAVAMVEDLDVAVDVTEADVIHWVVVEAAQNVVGWADP